MTAFDALPPFPLQALSALRDTAGNGPGAPASLLARAMRRGTSLHQAGLPEYAMLEFEQALATARGNAARAAEIANAASALASVLLQLGMGNAAYRCLMDNRQAIEKSAEGNCNLGVAAAAIGQLAEARAFYTAALRLDASHMRSVLGMSRLAAAGGLWDESLRHAAHAAAHRPQELDVHLHLIDTLLQARRPSDALRATGVALERLPGAPNAPALRLRQGLAQAFIGAWENARQALSGCDPVASDVTLRQLGLTLGTRADPPGHQGHPAPAWDVVALYIQYATLATHEAEWLYEKALPDVLRTLLRTPQAASRLAWRCARPVVQSLALGDAEIAAVHAFADATLTPSPAQRAGAAAAGSAGIASTAARPQGDDRLRVGLFVPRLSTAGMAPWLQAQVALHDATRFAIHVYAHTPRPEARWVDALKPRTAQVVETAHMTDGELLARIQIDALDLLVDFSTDTPDARPAVMAQHPARVMLRDSASFPNHPTPPHGPYDYALSDVFVHPGDLPAQAGAIVRLPFSGCIAPTLHPADVDGTPSGVVRLGADVPPEALDPETFGAWMQVLAQCASAQLHLPGYAPYVQARLHRHASQHKIEAGRIAFAAPDNRPVPGLALDQRPDLLLDPVRRSVPRAVAYALAAGIPAIACASSQTRSRPGAAILHAAGLAQTVSPDAAAYVSLLTRLASDAQALAQLRTDLISARLTAPWWNAAARTREREAAWMRMVESVRDGRAPAAFDVQPAS